MRIKLAFILLTGTMIVSAQESEVLLKNYTLRQCIDYAIEHNITVRQSANEVEQSAVEVSSAKWARLPSLNGSAGENWAWGRSGVTEKDADGKEFQVYKNTYNYGTNVSLSASIPLFTGFELPNQYALAKLNFKAAVADLNKAKDDIAIQVASAYLQVLLNQELRQVAINQTKLSKEQADRIARLQEVGKASPAEVAEGMARVAQDKLYATQADNNYQIALLDLSQLLELETPRLFSIQNADTTFILTARRNLPVCTYFKTGNSSCSVPIVRKRKKYSHCTKRFLPTTQFRRQLGHKLFFGSNPHFRTANERQS